MSEYYKRGTFEFPFDTYSERHIHWAFKKAIMLGKIAQSTLGRKTELADKIRILQTLNRPEQTEQTEQSITINHFQIDPAKFFPDYVFNWIDRSDRRLLIWFYLQACSLANIPDFLPAKNLRQEPQNPLRLELDELYNEAVAIIDNLDCHNTHLSEYVRNLDDTWRHIRMGDDDISFIDLSNSNQLKWAFDYMKKKRVYTVFLSPINNEEYKYAVLATLDYMTLHFKNRYTVELQLNALANRELLSRDKELFLIRMNRSWSQQKYRESEKAKKARSFQMTDEIFFYLEKLAKKNCATNHEILETLIRKSYQATFNKNKE